MKKIGKILLAFFACILLIGCAKEEKTTPGKDPYKSIYKLDEFVIKIYKYNDETIRYKVSGRMENQGESEIKKGKLSLEAINDKTKAEIKDDSLIITNGTDDFKSGTYKNVGDYTLEEYYSDFYGEKEYINSDYNGVYKKDGIELLVYQMNKNTVRFLLIEEDEATDLRPELKSDGTFAEDFFGDEYILKFEKDKVTLTYKGEESKDISGTYEKTDKLKIEDIVEKFD